MGYSVPTQLHCEYTVQEETEQGTHKLIANDSSAELSGSIERDIHTRGPVLYSAVRLSYTPCNQETAHCMIYGLAMTMTGGKKEWGGIPEDPRHHATSPPLYAPLADSTSEGKNHNSVAPTFTNRNGKRTTPTFYSI